jgi:hypothetical protein
VSKLVENEKLEQAQATMSRHPGLFFFGLNLHQAAFLCPIIVQNVSGAVYVYMLLCSETWDARPKTGPTEQRGRATRRQTNLPPSVQSHFRERSRGVLTKAADGSGDFATVAMPLGEPRRSGSESVPDTSRR